MHLALTTTVEDMTKKHHICLKEQQEGWVGAKLWGFLIDYVSLNWRSGDNTLRNRRPK